MGDLYVLFDIGNDAVIEGPMQLPGKLLALSMEQLNALGWYLALPVEYDIGVDFDENAYVRTSLNFDYRSEPYPAIRRLVGTQPRPIDEVRSYVIAKMTEFRNELFDKGFTYGGYVFDADKDSRLNWTAAVASVTSTAFMYGLPFQSIDSAFPVNEWTRRDNAEALLLPSEIIVCGLKLGKWASDCFKYCRAKKTEALNAETFEECWNVWKNNHISLWPNSNLGGTLSLQQPS